MNKIVLNPASAVLSIICYSLLIAFRDKFYLTDLMPIVVSILISDFNYKKIIKRLFMLNLFIIFLVSTIIIFYNDYKKAELIFIRSNLLIILPLIIFSEKNPIYCYFGFKYLKFPEKFNLLMFFTIKYIEILQAEYGKIKTALKLKNFKMKTDIFTYKIIAYIIGMLFMKTMQKAKNMQEAMILRGFNGKMYSLKTEKIKFNDYIILSALFLQYIIWMYI